MNGFVSPIFKYHTSFSWSYLYTLYNLTQGRTGGQKKSRCDWRSQHIDRSLLTCSWSQLSLWHCDKDWEIERRKVHDGSVSWTSVHGGWLHCCGSEARMNIMVGRYGRINLFTPRCSESRKERQTARDTTPSWVCRGGPNSCNEVLPSSSYYLLNVVPNFASGH